MLTTTTFAQSVDLAAWDYGMGMENPVITTEMGLTATPLSSGVGLEERPTLSKASEAYLVRSDPSADLAVAIANDRYISLTLTPPPGKMITVENLRYSPLSHNASRTFSVLSSATGFTVDDSLASFTIRESNGRRSNPLDELAVAIGATSEPLELRFYIHTNDASATRFNYKGFGGADSLDLVVEGTLQDDPRTFYTLTTSGTNGSIMVDPDRSLYVENSTVTLTPQPDAGYRFDGWSGDASGDTAPLVLTMDGNKSITAMFSEVVTTTVDSLPPFYTTVPEHAFLVPVMSLLTDSSQFTDNLMITATARDVNVLMNLQVDYQAGDQTAVVRFTSGTIGTTGIDFEVTDNGNRVSQSLVDNVSMISPHTEANRGVIYEAKDVPHWQPRPYKVNATNQVGYPITLQETQMQGTGDMTFFQGILSGILLPPVTGTYEFEVSGDGAEGRAALWIAEGLDYSGFPNEADPFVPTGAVASRDTPGSIMLQAGVPYYFEAHHRQVVNDWDVEVKWKRPGDAAFSRISDAYVVRFLDRIAPTMPMNLTTVVGETSALLRWDAATDDQALAGYQVMVNGTKWNDDLVADTEFFVDSLMGETNYELAVVAVDVFGNHSMPSALHRITTAANSTVPAALPTQFTADVVTAFKAEVSWSSSPDALGYNIYVDGQRRNVNMLTDTSYVIDGLQPETSYLVELRTLNVSLMESASAKSLNIMTVEFDVNNPDEDLYLAEVNVDLTPKVKATGVGVGFGINRSGALLLENPTEFAHLMDEFHPAGFRFGAIEANSASFQEATGTSPEFVTYGEYANAVKEAGGNYLFLTVGPGENEDYVTNPTTAFNNLLEYLGGDGTTDGGARRVAEGFTAPFLPQFDAIFIELGNEVWGRTHGVAMGQDYTNEYLPWVQRVTDIIQASPYYDAEKVKVTISGRGPRFPDLVQPEIFGSDTLDMSFPYILAFSGYVGGNIMDQGEVFGSLSENRLAYHKESYDRMATYLNNMDRVTRNAIVQTGRAWPFFPYETNSTQTNYHGSLGQALLTMDYTQEYIKHGAVLPTLFDLDAGQWRLVTETADGIIKRPLFDVAALFNQRTRDGVLLESSTVSSRQLENQFGLNYELEPVGVHAYNRDSEYTVMFFSRDFEQDYLVKLNLPGNLGAITNGKRTVLTGDSYDAMSTMSTEENINVEAGMLVSVPKHSLVVITFEATDFNLTAPLIDNDFTAVTSIDLDVEGGTYRLDDQAAYLTLTVDVQPDSAFVTEVDFFIIDPDTTNARLLNNLLYAGDKNGTIQVYARSVSNPDVFSDTLTIVIDKSTFVPTVPTALKVNTPPALDGSLDSAWTAAAAHQLTNVVVGQSNGETLAAQHRLLWDDDYLYLHVEITDDVLRTNPQASEPFDWDAVEVYIDALNLKNNTYVRGNDAQYVSAHLWDGPQTWKTNHASKEGLLVEDMVTDKGYNKVWAFPWSTIGRDESRGDSTGIQPMTGDTLGLDVHVNDNDLGSGRERKITWSATVDQAWNNPSLFGEIILDEYRMLQGIALAGNDTVTLGVAETYRALVDYTPTNATVRQVMWMVDDETVATVSTSGLVTAVGEGMTYVVATSNEGGYTDTLHVVVSKPVTGVMVTPSSDQKIEKGEELQLTAEVMPADAPNQGVSWMSSDPAIASVDQTGLVTGITDGDVLITVTTDQLGFSDTVRVSVVTRVDTMYFLIEGVTLQDGGTLGLAPLAVVLPAGATDPSIIWTSENAAIVAVDSMGVITAQATGTVRITATTRDGGLTDFVMVTVERGQPVGPTGQVLREYWTGIPGDSIEDLLQYADYPYQPTGTDYLNRLEAIDWNLTGRTQTWADNYGQRIRGYIHPDTTGEYVFWIAGDDQCELWLSTDADPGNKVRIASVEDWTRQYEWRKSPTQRSASISLQEGSKYYVEILNKEGAGGDRVAVGWRKPGESGDVPTEIVPGSVLSSVDPTELLGVKIAIEMEVGQTTQLQAILEPHMTQNQNVSWYSTDPNVIQVTQQGLITAVWEGRAAITVVTEEGGFTDELHLVVTVVPARLTDSNVPEVIYLGHETKLYPNPTTSDQVTLELRGYADERVQIAVYDVRGQRVLSEEWSVDNDEHDATLKIGNLRAGVYHVTVVGAEETQHLRMVIAR
ncbi:MAG: Ig-like domain-containing protein [Catalinimonas sp.]